MPWSVGRAQLRGSRGTDLGPLEPQPQQPLPEVHLGALSTPLLPSQSPVFVRLPHPVSEGLRAACLSGGSQALLQLAWGFLRKRFCKLGRDPSERMEACARQRLVLAVRTDHPVSQTISGGTAC